MALLLLLLVVLPVVELLLIVRVAGEIGILDTFLLLAGISLVGVWLAQRAGLGVVKRIRQAQAAGRVPSREVADGALVLLGGILLVLPGFISDLVGITLLLPPSRAAVRTLALRRFARRSQVVVVSRSGYRDRTDTGQAEIRDAESWEENPRPRRRGRIGDGS